MIGKAREIKQETATLCAASALIAKNKTKLKGIQSKQKQKSEKSKKVQVFFRPGCHHHGYTAELHQEAMARHRNLHRGQLLQRNVCLNAGNYVN